MLGIKKYLLIVPVLLASLVFIGSGTAKAYNYTDQLIDDSSFTASGTMSAADIQNFLVSKNSSLANFADIEDCYSPGGSHYSFYQAHFTCGGWQLASKIIYDVSQAYGINPQVILATLQKEQSLVTAQHPADSQYAYAMGYACPDSGGCGAVSGFFHQVENGTWQFKVDYELASGRNYWGYTPSSYPCNGPTQYYNKALLPGNDVVFLDDYGTGYTHFVIPNASVATLYCYTPHAYPGSAQQYFSGSYWFVYYYNLWFVPYSAQPVWQSVFTDSNKTQSLGWNATLTPGQDAWAVVKMQNTGSVTWTKGGGANDVRLATYGWGRVSSFCAGRWITTSPNCTRPAGLTESSVAPGQTGTFEFPINAPTGINLYNESFGLVVDGKTVFPNGFMNFQFNVVPQSYQAQPVWQGVFSSSAKTGAPTWNYSFTPGQNAWAVVVLKNTSNFTWTKGGTNDVRMVTYNNWGRVSNFCAGLWSIKTTPDCTRPGTFNEASVAPGQNATFEFNLNAPTGVNNYNEAFGLVVDGKSIFNSGFVNFQLNVHN
jgi:hypothetical protein